MNQKSKHPRLMPLSCIFFSFLAASCGNSDSSKTTPANTSNISFATTPFTLTRGTQVSIVPDYTGPEKPVSCTVDPALTPGLTLNANDCRISGAPAAPSDDVMSYLVTASYASGMQSTATLFMTVDPARMYVGAYGTLSNQGAVYSCDLNGQNCAKISNPTSGQDGFGVSLAANQFGLFVGAYAKDSSAGAVYRCDPDGTNCASIFNPPALSQFGASLLATDDALFVGAPIASAQGTGTVYKCKADGTNCAVFYTAPRPNGFFGAALFATKTDLYVAERNANTIYDCKLDGSGCRALPTPPEVQVSDLYGSSLFVYQDKLYVGAKQADNGLGSVYQCNLDGTGCTVFASGANRGFTQNLFFGSFISSQNSWLYIGSPGNINSAPATPGLIYKCTVSQPTSCSVLDTDATPSNGDIFGRSFIFF